MARQARTFGGGGVREVKRWPVRPVTWEMGCQGGQTMASQAHSLGEGGSCVGEVSGRSNQGGCQGGQTMASQARTLGEGV